MRAQEAGRLLARFREHFPASVAGELAVDDWLAAIQRFGGHAEYVVGTFIHNWTMDRQPRLADFEEACRQRMTRGVAPGTYEVPVLEPGMGLMDPDQLAEILAPAREAIHDRPRLTPEERQEATDAIAARKEERLMERARWLATHESSWSPINPSGNSEPPLTYDEVYEQPPEPDADGLGHA